MSTSPPPAPDDSLRAGLVVKPVKTSPTRRSPPPQPPRSPALWRQILSGVGIVTLWAGVGSLLSLSLWVSALFILRPQPPPWLRRYGVTGATEWGAAPPQTLATIKAALPPAQRAGTLLDLALISEDPDLKGLKLLPIWEQRSPCSEPCEAIVELRLYGLHHREQQTEYLQLRHQLAVQGPTEAEVLEAIVHSDIGTRGSTYQLPLSGLTPLPPADLPGSWLTLTGRWQSQGSPVLYGQLLHVSPQTGQISPLLLWKSPPGRLPTWHDLDGIAPPELLVNQSYGLEPNFRFYRVGHPTAANAPAHLQEIGLNPLESPLGEAAPAYQNALFLAQQGLWSQAERLLLPLKAQLGPQWSPDLEQQLQLIASHARFSQSQADRDWSQPSQKLLALLLDGQWAAALKTVNEGAVGFDRAVLPLLERDANRLWQRLTASLKVSPQQREAQLWGALLLLAKENEAAALKWLTNGQNTPLKQEFEAIAQKVAIPAAVPAAPVAAPAPAPAPASPVFSSLLGTATPLAQVVATAWQTPTAAATLTLPPGQRWYAITLEAGYGRQQWQRSLSPPTPRTPAAVEQFWRSLGLSSPPTLQLVNVTTGQGGPTVQINAMQRQGEGVMLLARGATLPPGRLIAVPPGQWQAATTGSAQPLAALLAAAPDGGDRLRSTLQSHLGVDPAPLLAAPNPGATGQWVTFIDGADPQLLLTVPGGLGGNLPRATLIMTAQGELLYSNLWGGAGQTLQGWLQPPAGGTAVLMVTQGDRAIPLFWSPRQRRFQE
ncbi:MAG TPA: hypothetical protein V6D02_07070 [Candidatus Obscuribacterales bacterium]